MIRRCGILAPKARRNRRRRGAAAVEMAVVTPLLMTMLLGIVEFSWVFSIRQALANAAREGARVAVLPGSTDTEVYQRVNGYLAPFGITSHTVDLTRATAADPVETVHVHVPYVDVTLIGAYFGSQNYDLGHTVSMRKEGLD